MERQLKKYDFNCKRCGKCCSGRFGDNAVYVRFDEIEEISKKTKLSPSEISVPLIPKLYSFSDYSKNSVHEVLEQISFQIDEDGIVHTPGRMLKREKFGDCIFLDAKTKSCLIYDFRPDLCKTYPFYTVSGRLNTCECEGLNDCGFDNLEKTNDTVKKISVLLEKREFKDKVEMESIRTHFSKYGSKIFGTKEGLKKAIENADNKIIKCIVYGINGVNEVDYLIE